MTRHWLGVVRRFEMARLQVGLSACGGLACWEDAPREDELLGRVLDPAAFGGEARVGADGADHAVAGDRGVDGVLDQVFEGVAHVIAAQVEEARGVGVTVEGCHRAQVVVLDNAVGMDPVDELLVDGFAFWVFADHAFACVTCSKCGLCCSAGARAI
ncbi:MAG: hypothetical protein WA766_06625 [Candidatus Acidiferrales bacterium]